MATSNLTIEEIERMRQIVQQADSQREPVRTIDLNNPPKLPYRFQKFPMMVYRPDSSHHITVRSEAELQVAESDGWVQEAPSIVEVEQAPLSAAYQAEVGKLEAHLEEARRNRRKTA